MIGKPEQPKKPQGIVIPAVDTGEGVKALAKDAAVEPLLQKQDDSHEGGLSLQEKLIRGDFFSVFHLGVFSVGVRIDKASIRQYKGMEGFLDPAPQGFIIMQDNSFGTTGETFEYSVIEDKKSSVNNSIAGRLSHLHNTAYLDVPVSIDRLRAWVDNPNFFPAKYKARHGLRYYIPGTLVRGETVRIPYVTYEGGVVQCALAHMATGWNSARDRFLFYTN
jgi:hypothetical protein